MGDHSLSAEKGVHGTLDRLENDEDNYDEDVADLINDLEEFEIQDFNSKSFKGLDAVSFDEELDDEELLEYCRSSKRALVPYDESEQEDDGPEIGSDEEQDILKQIREDIELKVREEMQDELKHYQERMKAIQDRGLPERTDDEKNNAATVEEDDEMNPQLREAIIKMNKLDKILKKKVKREKEVKRERILLERRMRQEISEMEHGASNYREIKMNTAKFLALAPPPSHNEGISIEPDEEEEMPPLFQTQIDESELDRRKKERKGSDGDKLADSQDNGQPRSGSSISSHGTRSRLSKSGINLGSQSQNKTKKKDFIKRNKELAADADQPVAMTDDEKRRLQSLLDGVDEMPEIENRDDITSLVDLNPFQLSAQPGEGFCPDSNESRTLSSIDQRLRGLMPEEDFKSLFATGGLASAGAGGTMGATPSQPLFTRVGLHSTGNDAAALERFGQRVLYETKEERELKARLLAIESQLEQFKAPHEMEDESTEDCHLTDQQLDELLDQCARNMSHTVDTDTPDSTPRSQMSSRQSLLANPPRLTDEQLQQLLSDAQFPLSSRLLALRDDDQKLEEEDGSTEMIRAETWIAIRDAELNEGIGTKAGDTAQLKDISESELHSDSKIKSGKEQSIHDDLTHSENISTNNAYHTDRAGVSSKASQPESREIDDFAFTPDITNSAYISDGDARPLSSHPSLSGHHRSLGVDQERDKEVREGSGGARVRTNGSVELPRLPHPPLLSSSSSSIRTSADSDATMRLGASSLLSSSRKSFDSSASIPTSHNNNGVLDGVQSPVRLPEISSNSFLIHTPQGMNNDERAQSKSSLPSRPPLQMVRNNLSDISVTSLSTSERGESATPTSEPSPAFPAGQKISGSPAGRRGPQTSQVKQPTPPAVKKQT